MSHSFAVLLNRRYASRPFVSKDKEEKLRKLDAVAPVRTLEEFWANLKAPVASEEGDDQFNWYVCLILDRIAAVYPESGTNTDLLQCRLSRSCSPVAKHPRTQMSSHLPQRLPREMVLEESL